MCTPSEREPGEGGTAVLRVLMLLAAIGAVLLVWRGPIRGVSNSADFAIVYGSARAWLTGRNPYDAAEIGRAWLGAGGPADRSPAVLESAVFLYPPPTFAMLAPIAALPWAAAKIAWAGLNLALWGVTILCAARVAGFGRWSTAWWGVVAGGVWLAPAWTSMSVGQTCIVAGVGAAAAWRLRAGGREPGLLAGALLGAGAALKPQLSGLFAAYEVWRGRWRAAASAGGIAALLLAIGVARMEIVGVPWRASLSQNVASFTTASNGDPTRANPIRYHLLNLHYPLHSFTDDRDAVRWAVYAIVGVIGLAFLAADRAARRREDRADPTADMTCLSMAAVASLLVVYHRFYDGVVLIWPLALGVRLLADPRRRPEAATLLVLIGPFFLPGASMLVEGERRGWVPAGLTGSWLWQGLIMPHEAWSLLAMALVLIRIRRGPRPA
jgi:hypothetical protein